jgi:hypothetical protein
MRKICLIVVLCRIFLKKGRRNSMMKVFWLGVISSYRFVGGKEGKRSPPKAMIFAENEEAISRSS